jgi:hypothetical protein
MATTVLLTDYVYSSMNSPTPDPRIGQVAPSRAYIRSRQIETAVKPQARCERLTHRAAGNDTDDRLDARVVLAATYFSDAHEEPTR